VKDQVSHPYIYFLVDKSLQAYVCWVYLYDLYRKRSLHLLFLRHFEIPVYKIIHTAV
jgi:hypothetical protein